MISSFNLFALEQNSPRRKENFQNFEKMSLEKQISENKKKNDEDYDIYKYIDVKKDKNKKKFIHLSKDIPLSHRFAHLGLMYIGQWTTYLYTQEETIKEEGSFHNWHNNMTRIHMDKDSYDFNLIQHSIAGNYYYLYYRHWGYTKSAALLWSTMSVVLFEFTIETTTEQPSVQDIYQTPILGAVLGMGMETASNYLITKRCKILKVVGYMLNPFAIFPHSSYQYHSIPLVAKNFGGIGLAMTF